MGALSRLVSLLLRKQTKICFSYIQSRQHFAPKWGLPFSLLVRPASPTICQAGYSEGQLVIFTSYFFYNYTCIYLTSYVFLPI